MGDKIVDVALSQGRGKLSQQKLSLVLAGFQLKRLEEKLWTRMGIHLKMRPARKDRRTWGFLGQKPGSMTGCGKEVSKPTAPPVMEG